MEQSHRGKSELFQMLGAIYRRTERPPVAVHNSGLVVGSCIRGHHRQQQVDAGKWQIPLKKSVRSVEPLRAIIMRVERRPSSGRDRHWHRDQLCEFAEVLGGCCEVELVAGAVRSS